VRAILPEWCSSNSNVLTEDIIKLCRRRIGLQLDQWVRGEENLEQGARICNECRADLEEFLAAGEVNEEDLTNVEYVRRVLPKVGRFMQLQAKTPDSKFVNDLKQTQNRISLRANRIPRISMRDKDNVAKGDVTTLGPGLKAWKDAACINVEWRDDRGLAVAESPLHSLVRTKYIQPTVTQCFPSVFQHPASFLSSQQHHYYSIVSGAAYSPQFSSVKYTVSPSARTPVPPILP
jgi:hypothetical protein